MKSSKDRAMTLWLECGALHEHEGPDALQRALEEHEADVRADERAHMSERLDVLTTEITESTRRLGIYNGAAPIDVTNAVFAVRDMASAIERMRAAALPASVVEAMAAIRAHSDVLSAIREAEGRATDAEFSQAKGERCAVFCHIADCAAWALHAIALLTAEQEQSR